MSDKWKVTHEKTSLFRTAVRGLFTAGLGPVVGGPDRVFTLENEQTGETRTITTNDPSTLGELIAKGEFD
jgi:hypothetical protein